MPTTPPPTTLLIHYKTFRKVLGWMGFLLPFALIAGSFIWDGGHIETSISNYFYTCLRDLFVVTLAAMALFLFTYKGYDKTDGRVTNIAGVFGLAAAFISTNFKCDITLPCYEMLTPKVDSLVCKPCTLPALDPNCVSESYKIIPCPHPEYIGYIHLGCAALFFFALAYMSYFQFTKTLVGETPTPQKLKRNKFYKACAIIIVLCLLALAPCFFKDSIHQTYNKYNLIFWGESVSLWAFGASWLVKGEFLLFKDKVDVK